MNRSPENCYHLKIDHLLEIHSDAIADHGGTTGIRDVPLLESAIAAPKATISGHSPYRDLVEVAAAYLFYICKNHPFLDGNKRAALGACVVFLKLNGIQHHFDDQTWEDLVLEVASGTLNRDQTTARLRSLIVGA